MTDIIRDIPLQNMEFNPAKNEAMMCYLEGVSQQSDQEAIEYEKTMP